MTKKNIIKIYQTPILVFFQVIFEILLSDIIWIIIVTFSRFEDKHPFFSNFTFSEGIFLVLLLFQLLVITFIFLQWIKNYYWFEDIVLFHHKGILFSQIDEYLLIELEAVQLEQGLIGKFFDYGNIKLIFPNKKIILKYFPHPHEVLFRLKSIKNMRTKKEN